MMRLLIFLIAVLSIFSQNLIANDQSLVRTSQEVAGSFFKAHKVESVKVSPNGEYVVLVQNIGNRTQYHLLNTTTFERDLIIHDRSNDQIDIIDYYWIDNQSIVYEAYIHGKGRGLLATDITLKDGKVENIRNRYLLDGVFMVNSMPGVKNKFIVGKWSNDKTSLYKFDISKDALEGQVRSKHRLNKRGPKASYWLTNDKGGLAVGFGLDRGDDKNKVWIKPKKSKKWKTVWEGDSDIVFRPVLMSENNKTLYVLSNEKDDLVALYEYHIDTKSYGQKIYGKSSVDLSGALISSDTKSLIGVSYIEDGFLKRTYFSELDKVIDGALKVAVNESTPYIVDFAIDKSVAVVETSSSNDPGTFHLYRVDTMELIKIASKAPWLEEYELATSQIIKSNSKDGQEIESYLTLPTTNTDEAPPLIVLPHGGPISVQDTRHFNSHVQFLTAMGYAVLQPNYRGSSGYGKSFEEKGKGQWGRLIEQDIQSGITEVIKQKLINPDKICIYGISYGGYSALISAINEPGIYKCAASYAGVTDLQLLFNNLELAKSERLKKLMEKIVGNPETDLDELIEFSPVYNAQKISIPIFIAQGDEDQIVDMEHYNRMLAVMDAYGIRYESMMLRGEGHGFKYLQSIVSFYSKLDEFFKTSLKIEN